MKIRLFNQDEGYYIPSFMYINISEHIDMQEFEENSSEIKGTFIHEYCHYLQDISTTYGYNKFICVFQDLLYGLFPNQYEQQNKELQWNKDFLSLHTGTEKLNEIIICINSVQIINNPLCEEIESEMNSQCVIVGYNGCKEFEFGNHCIIEGMAYLVEKQLYDVREPDNEFPYRICKMICEKEYNEFAQNEIHIIALCELALLESYSAVFFIKALRLMKENHFLPRNVEELEEFISNHFSICFRGNRNNIVSLLDDAYPEVITGFSEIKEWIITRFELGAICREKSKCFIALALSNKELRFNCWQQIMDGFGGPNIVVGCGELLQGAYLNDKEIDIRYMLAPMAIYMALHENKPICPLINICKQDKDANTLKKCKENFYEKKDEEYLCPVALFCKIYNIER